MYSPMLPAQFPSYDSWEILIKIGMIIIFPRKNGLPIYTTFFGHTPLNQLGNPPIKSLASTIVSRSTVFSHAARCRSAHDVFTRRRWKGLGGKDLGWESGPNFSNFWNLLWRYLGFLNMGDPQGTIGCVPTMILWHLMTWMIRGTPSQGNLHIFTICRMYTWKIVYFSAPCCIN